MKKLAIMFLSIIATLSPGLLQAQTPDDFNPVANSSVYTLAVQADGKILAGGNFTTLGGQRRNRIARLNPDGSLDSSFNPGANGDVFSLAVQADGKILAGGTFTAIAGQTRNYIARLNADGTLDSSFDPGANSSVESLGVQADGKILAGGSFTTLGGQSRSRIARLNADGSLDSSFSQGANNTVLSLAVQANGKILVGGGFTTLGGQTRNRIARINADGSLDGSFNPGADSFVRSLAVQADGKILTGGTFTTLGGQTRNRIARLNADDTVDTSFNPGADNSVFALIVQADAKILVGGAFTTLGGQSRNRIARINADGSLDNSFDAGADNSVLSLTLQGDGKILVGGGLTALGGQPRSFIARLNNNTLSSQTLTVSGTSQIDWTRGGSAPEVEQVTFESWNGSTWISQGAATRVSGGWQKTGLSLPVNGWIRTSGRAGCGLNNGSSGIVAQVASYGSPATPNVSVLLVGGETLNNGSASLDFGAVHWPSSGDTKTIAITNSGNAPLSGLALGLGGANPGDFNITPLASTTLAPGASTSFEVGFSPLSSGSKSALFSLSSNDPDDTPFQIALGGISIPTDPSFDPNANSNVFVVAGQPDGKVLVGGSFTSIGGQVRNRLARFHADGSLDSGFNPDANGSVWHFAVQADGKVLVGGSFTSIGGQTRNNIARLNADGSLDSLFNPNCNGMVGCMAIAADGKILIGGDFTTVGGQTRHFIARLNIDGSVDPSFNPDANSGVRCMALDSAGKILVGGGFTTIGGQTRNYLARFNQNGTLDSGFNPGTNSAVVTMAVQSDDKILVGGIFSTIGGQARNRMARLDANGVVDAAYNPNVNDSPFSFAVQADGKVIVGGAFSSIGGLTRQYLARLNADGTVDAGFLANADSLVNALYLQKDGKVCVGGIFTSIGGSARNRIARLTNNPAVSSIVVTGASQIDWQTGGTTPEMHQVVFESWNGSSWSTLGNASRVVGGYRLNGLTLSASGQIRARGRTTGGYRNGSSNMIEHTLIYGPPDIALEAPTGTNVTTGNGTHAFGIITSGQTQDITCTLRNTGGTELTGITPSILGTGASSFSLPTPPPATLAAGGSATFTVRFSATSGAKTATLSIASDDPDENPFTLSLTGTGNTAPTFAGYSVATPWQTAASISLGKLLSKASDADGDTLTVTAAGPTSAQGGTAVLQSGSILYTPPANFSGSDTFSVTLADPYGATVSGTVTVGVAPNPTSGGVGVNPPQITMLGNGDASVGSQGIPGRTYMIQRSTDLNYWTTIGTTVAASNGVVTFIDENPPPGSAFYRLGRNVPVMNFWGDGSDGPMITSGNVSLASVQDGDVVVKQYTNLTINAGHTLTTQTRCRGLVIYVNGDCTINGTLSMTARGAIANPTLADSIPATGIRLARFKYGSNETLSASDLGGTGAGGVGSQWRTAEAGQLGIAGNGRIYTIAREGGAGGGANHSNDWWNSVPGGTGGTHASGSGGGGGGNAAGGWSGAGSAGTCYSGGAGGGAVRTNGYATSAGHAAPYGGAGGYGNWTSPHDQAGGGAGNNGGSGIQPGQNGTGGLLVLLVKGNLTIGSTGQVVSRGSNGGSAYQSGGGSGGGRILILHAGTYSAAVAPSAAGGSGGGGGGAGAITIEQIDP
jgi:uncharacterized delta-60 repeat protein